MAIPKQKVRILKKSQLFPEIPVIYYLFNICRAEHQTFSFKIFILPPWVGTSLTIIPTPTPLWVKTLKRYICYLSNFSYDSNFFCFWNLGNFIVLIIDNIHSWLLFFVNTNIEQHTVAYPGILFRRRFNKFSWRQRTENGNLGAVAPTH